MIYECLFTFAFNFLSVQSHLMSCRDSPCQNNAKCINIASETNGYICDCIYPWNGQNCDIIKSTEKRQNKEGYSKTGYENYNPYNPYKYPQYNPNYDTKRISNQTVLMIVLGTVIPLYVLSLIIFILCIFCRRKTKLDSNVNKPED